MLLSRYYYYIISTYINLILIKKLPSLMKNLFKKLTIRNKNKETIVEGGNDPY